MPGLAMPKEESEEATRSHSSAPGRSSSTASGSIGESSPPCSMTTSHEQRSPRCVSSSSRREVVCGRNITTWTAAALAASRAGVSTADTSASESAASSVSMRA